MDDPLSNNRTLRILRNAEDGEYGVLAQICYDAQSAVAVVRAAERIRSPAILMMFPVTLKYAGGISFLRFCLDLAHEASVPIAVHLDHATDQDDLEYVLDMAAKGAKFDSIMVDASHAETDEENVLLSRPYVQRAHEMGIAVEVELGRMEGGEAGLRTISDAKLTDPAKAELYMRGTGANILAPSIGNLHGKYINPPNFRQDILKDLKAMAKGKIHLCLHGTDDLPDELFLRCIENGITKINVNSAARQPYVQSLLRHLGHDPLPDAIEKATEAFASTCERLMRLFGSAGKTN
ncbi:hypothetical protein AMATHDRAFT_149714 [Amanita thiersii Skay4041]|uniref:Fructose-bisphosphate aldolase n=1 Tax=Amanita thiersii Skay4041 TaxID=703135 RepID=A0A2A9NJP5_9AGAR|nr:hypothetical protein AMATHDRAFT_149714 [Amanita thiersii Skay4041]